jgi:G patch domain-containing protein 1
VYDNGLKSHRGRRFVYDDDDDNDRISMGSSKSARPATGGSSRVPGVTQTFRDGRPVLEGFVLSDQPVAEEQWFVSQV